jgi:dihydrofolate reductase
MNYNNFIDDIEEAIKEREAELNDLIRKGQGGDLANNAWYIVQELRILLNKVQKRLED